MDTFPANLINRKTLKHTHTHTHTHIHTHTHVARGHPYYGVLPYAMIQTHTHTHTHTCTHMGTHTFMQTHSLVSQALMCGIKDNCVDANW